jgi:hypothetical protein
VPVLWRIHAVGLDCAHLEIYHARFPSSIVTTPCAVPIAAFSEHPHEEEVLLRGPFVQLVQVQTVWLENGSSMDVMDGVMLDTSRDHPSTMELDESEGQRARELFLCLIATTRMKALASEFGLHP